MTTSNAILLLTESLDRFEFPSNYLRLLQEYIGIDSNSIDENELTTTQIELLKTVLEKIKNDTPIEYIVGFAEFYGNRFMVTPDTLIPRPLTESIVEETLSYISEHTQKNSYFFIDIGTGSGCIILSIIKELKEKFPEIYKKSTFMATDISPLAIKVAQRNAELLEINNITFVEQDGIPLLPDTPEVMVIMSNPPYIPNDEMVKLPKSVANYEPLIALERNTNLIKSIRLLPEILSQRGKTGCVVIEDTEKGMPFIERMTF